MKWITYLNLHFNGTLKLSKEKLKNLSLIRLFKAESNPLFENKRGCFLF